MTPEVCAVQTGAGKKPEWQAKTCGLCFFFFFHKDCGLKKIYSRLKLRVLFYWVGIFRTSSPGDASQVTLRELL